MWGGVFFFFRKSSDDWWSFFALTICKGYVEVQYTRLPWQALAGRTIRHPCLGASTFQMATTDWVGNQPGGKHSMWES